MNQQQYEYEVMRELELRDYFAAKAMVALIALKNAAGTTTEWVAKTSYAMADEMIKQKDRK